MKPVMFFQGIAAVCLIFVAAVYCELDCYAELHACGEEAIKAGELEEDHLGSMRFVSKKQFCLLRETLTQCHRKLNGVCDVGETWVHVNATFEFLKIKNANFQCERPDAPALSCAQTFAVCQQRAAENLKRVDLKDIVHAAQDIQNCIYFKEMQSCYMVHRFQGGGCDSEFENYILMQKAMGIESKCGDYFKDCRDRENRCYNDRFEGLGFNWTIANMPQFCNYTHTVAFCGRDLHKQCPFAANEIATTVSSIAGFPRCNVNECGLQQRKCLEITDQNILNAKSLTPLLFSKEKVCGFHQRARECGKGLTGQCAVIFNSTLEMLQAYSKLAGCTEQTQFE